MPSEQLPLPHPMILPLRIPLDPQLDLVTPLSSWLDNHGPFSADECRSDLERLENMRQTAVSENNANLETLSLYAAALTDFIQKGMDAIESNLQFRWTTSGNNNNDNDTHVDAYHTLAWERSNIVYNICVHHCRTAVAQPDDKNGYVAAGQAWAQASKLLSWQTDSLVHPMPQLFAVWSLYCQAAAQHAAYRAFGSIRTAKPYMMAKLAAAALPLYSQVEDSVERCLILVDPTLERCMDDWKDAVRTQCMILTAQTEHHQAQAHALKREYGYEIVRLQAALRFGRLAQRFDESIELPLDEWQEALDTATAQNEQRHHQPTPHHDDLPEIQHQVYDGYYKNLPIFPPTLDPPLFQNLLPPAARHYATHFTTTIHDRYTRIVQRAHTATEQARQALASISLPHALTAYRCECGGGGLPRDLQDRIATSTPPPNRQALWELRDWSEQAHAQFAKIQAQLDDDLECDRLFRQEYSFDGHHSVANLQATFRRTLQNYTRLMQAAQDSDELLLERVSALDQDAKFRLLQLPPHQLDHLVPAKPDHLPIQDTSALSQLLVDLSALFTTREGWLTEWRTAWQSYDVCVPLRQCNESEYETVVQQALEPYSSWGSQMDESIRQQDALLERIVQENQTFVAARGTNRKSEDFIVRLEEALDEMEQLSEHLREGRAFYDVILPKLSKLAAQVGDVSARLTMERCEFQERHERHEQEKADALLAARLPTQSNAPSSPVHGSSSSSSGVDDEKVASLVAMDFDPDKVVDALKRHDNNVDLALNDLLG